MTTFTKEPRISVGIVQNAKTIRGTLPEGAALVRGIRVVGEFSALNKGGIISLRNAKGREILRSREIHLRIPSGASFTLHDVVIGIQFHWERKEAQTFNGDLRLVATPKGTVTAINDIGVEAYLESVVSSEMSAEAPLELLRAHAITSRSWLVAMLERQKMFKDSALPSQRSFVGDDEIVRWYDREDHDLFDVCADDHCQRYHGITKIITPSAREAVRNTRGVFLMDKGEVCDARFHKACGGRTDMFENSWEDMHVPYLTTVSDSAVEHAVVDTEERAETWISTAPDAYCNTSDGAILREVLPSFDQETTDFYRWKVEYERKELEEILRLRSGIDFGTLLDLIPLRRGPSGRINRMRVSGTKRSVTVGKELEIRRWLSRSHLFSSAFVVRVVRAPDGVPVKFALHGAGWGHGVGLCQIGAAVMAAKGFKGEEIVSHYFRESSLKKLY